MALHDIFMAMHRLQRSQADVNELLATQYVVGPTQKNRSPKGEVMKQYRGEVMKQYGRSFTVAVLMLCALVTVSLDASAKTPFGGDNFDSNTLSPENWVEPAGQALEAQDGRLVYLTTGLGASDTKYVMWNKYVNDPLSWTYRIDVSMPAFVLTENQSLTFGLQVDGADGSHVFSYLTQFIDDQGQFQREIAGSTDPASALSVPATSDIATVQLHFDAPTRTISAEYDPDGPDATGHYSFSLLTSRGGFDPTNVFVIGQSTGGILIAAPSVVYGDNAQAAVVPEPNQALFFAGAIAFLGIWLRRKGQGSTR